MGHRELRSEIRESIENQKEFNDFSSLLLLFDRITIKITLNHCYGVTSLLVTRQNGKTRARQAGPVGRNGAERVQMSGRESQIDIKCYKGQSLLTG